MSEPEDDCEPSAVVVPQSITCESCGGEGRIYSGHPNDPHPRDEGRCGGCKGLGVVEVPTQPVELEDLELMASDAQ